VATTERCPPGTDDVEVIPPLRWQRRSVALQVRTTGRLMRTTRRSSLPCGGNDGALPSRYGRRGGHPSHAVATTERCPPGVDDGATDVDDAEVIPPLRWQRRSVALQVWTTWRASLPCGGNDGATDVDDAEVIPPLRWQRRSVALQVWTTWRSSPAVATTERCPPGVVATTERLMWTTRRSSLPCGGNDGALPSRYGRRSD
jgi:hypothetical protein